MLARVAALGVTMVLVMAASAVPALALADPRTPGAAEVSREAVLQGATSDPAVVSWGADRLDLFVRGSDNALWHKYYANSAWSGWESLGGGLASGPAVASWGAGHLDVFIRGTDNALWHKYYLNNAWSGWESLGGGITSDPAAVAWGVGRIDVFARGTDNALWHIFFANAWMGWERLGGSLVSGPGVASMGAGHLDVFFQGTDSALWHRYYVNNAWSDWGSLGGSLSSDPAAVSWGSGRIDVFARGSDGTLKHIYFANAWMGWENLTGTLGGTGSNALSSGPSVASWGVNRLDVFARGTDNNLYQKFWNAGWSDWTGQGAPGAVTAVLAAPVTATAVALTLPPVTVTGMASSLAVTWPAVPNAELYKIDRVKEGDPCCNRSWTVSPPTTSTSDAVTAGGDVVYQYTVTAMIAPNHTQMVLRGTWYFVKLNVQLEPPPSNLRSLKTVSPCAPATVTGGVPPASVSPVQQAQTTLVAVNWAPVTGAAAYLVERQHTGNGTWLKLGCFSATTLSFSETTRSDLPREETPYPGVGGSTPTYLYKVTAYTSTGAAGWNSGKASMIKWMGTPTGLTTTRTGNSVKLCWNPSTKADVGRPERFRIISSYGTDYSVSSYPWSSQFCTTEYGLPMGPSTFEVRQLYKAIPKYLETPGPSISVTVQP